MFDYIDQFRESFNEDILPHKHIRHSEYSLFLVPIKAKEFVYGFFVAIKPEGEFDDFEQIAIHHAATICALELQAYGLEERTID
jgi:hypothetical protein